MGACADFGFYTGYLLERRIEMLIRCGALIFYLTYGLTSSLCLFL